MIPTTAPELVDALRRTQVLNGAHLEAAQTIAEDIADAPTLAEHLVTNAILTRFQADQALQGFAHELALGQYVLLEEIGEGGMGHVFKAKQPRLNRIVALKMIREDLLAHQPGAKKRFTREAEAIAKLSSPHIVVVHDADEINGIHFLAMEYVDGIDLAKKVQNEGPLPVPVACDYIRQAAQGLQDAHEGGLVHRDIKPSNLLVARAGPPRGSSIFARRSPGADTPMPGGGARGPSGLGLVKILDMGLARILDDERNVSTLTQQGSVIGTPDFISPEQARDPSRADIRADIYSLGCTFYYLLAGRPPFHEGTPVEKLLKHQLDTPRALSLINPAIPASVQAVVQRMMRKKPEERYQEPQEVVDALAQVHATLLAGSSSTPVPSPGRLEIVADLDRNSGTPEVILPRAAVAAANQETQRTYAFATDMSVIPARRRTRLEKTSLTYVTGLAFSPDGQWLTTGGLDGKLGMWDVSGDRIEEGKSIPNLIGEIQFIAFSPTDKCLFTASSSIKGQMWRWDWTEEDWRRGLSPVPGEPGSVNALAVSSDGRQLAAAYGMDISLFTVNGRDITRSSTLKGHTGVIKSLAFSPDGKRVASAGEDRQVRIWEFGWFRNSQKAILRGHSDVIESVAFAPNGLLLATACRDHTIRLWDAAGNDLQARAVLTGHTMPVRLVQFVSKGNKLVSIGDNGQATLWDVTTQSKVREWAFDNKILPASRAVRGDGTLLALGANEGLVHLYDLEQPHPAQAVATAATF